CRMLSRSSISFSAGAVTCALIELAGAVGGAATAGVTTAGGTTAAGATRGCPACSSRFSRSLRRRISSLSACASSALSPWARAGVGLERTRALAVGGERALVLDVLRLEEMVDEVGRLRREERHEGAGEEQARAATPRARVRHGHHILPVPRIARRLQAQNRGAAPEARRQALESRR